MKKIIIALMTVASISIYAQEPWVLNCEYNEFTSEQVQLQMLVNRDKNGKLSCEVYTYDWHAWGENGVKSYYTVPCELIYNVADKSYSITDLSKKKKLAGKVYADAATVKLSKEGGITEGKDAFTYKGTIDTGLAKFSEFKKQDAKCLFYQKP